MSSISPFLSLLSGFLFSLVIIEYVCGCVFSVVTCKQKVSIVVFVRNI